MVVVRCLILCSKFSKNRLSARALWGTYSAPPDSLAGSWGKGGERRDRRAGGVGRGRGEGGEGNEGGGRGGD